LTVHFPVARIKQAILSLLYHEDSSVLEPVDLANVPPTVKDYNRDSSHYFPIKLQTGKIAELQPLATEVNHNGKVNGKSL